MICYRYNITINRPNHNLTHVHRVMVGIELVINYFSNYAQDKGFRAFCQNISPEEMESLRIAAAFSITGRESEINAGEDLDRYNGYREASANHFLAFCKESMSLLDEVMVERMWHVIRYMGNPHYETTLAEKQAINNIENATERRKRNYFHRILTIAHKLDLPRCYSSDQFTQAMQLCHNLSIKNEEQANAYIEMVRYMIELIKAHGGALNCDIEPDGKLVDTNKYYHDSYAESSHSIQSLFQFTRTISKPTQEKFEVIKYEEPETLELCEQFQKLRLS